MGLAATFVLLGSNLIISLLRKSIPDKVRIPAFITVIAGFVSIVQMLMMRRKSAHKHDADGGVTVEAPLTRQQRRHAAK